MKQLIKYFLLVFSFLLTFSVTSQLDTACVSKRWISIKNTELNAVLFDTTTSILKTIRELSEAHEIWVYTNENSSYHSGEWYPIPQCAAENHTSDYIDYLDQHDFFVIRVQSDIPWVDEYGDPIVVIDSTGFKSYKYDDPEIYLLKLTDIVEMRIREERTFNTDTKVFEGDFRPTGISFYIENEFETREIFWVNLHEVMSKVKNTPLPWQEFIQNREYNGFQYMQVSCYDDLIRY